jgi:hypothetical protein
MPSLPRAVRLSSGWWIWPSLVLGPVIWAALIRSMLP